MFIYAGPYRQFSLMNMGNKFFEKKTSVKKYSTKFHTSITSFFELIEFHNNKVLFNLSNIILTFFLLIKFALKCLNKL